MSSNELEFNNDTDAADNNTERVLERAILGSQSTAAQSSSIPPIASSSGSRNLGRAFLIIFQADASAVRKALKNLDAGSPLTNAIKSLVEPTDATESDAATDRAKEVSRPLIDKILKKGSDQEKKIAFTIFLWILTQEKGLSGSGNDMAMALLDDLGSASDKRQKLGALLVLEHALDRAGSSKPLSGSKKSTAVQEASDSTNEKASLDSEWLTECLLRIVLIIQNNVLVDSNGEKALTRLTTTAVDVAAAISTELSTQVMKEAGSVETEQQSPKIQETDDSGKLKSSAPVSLAVHYTRSIKSIKTILKELQKTSLNRNSIMASALEDTLDLVQRFLFRQQQQQTSNSLDLSVLFSFAQTWKLLSPLLAPRTAASLASLQSKSLNFVQMESIPPYLRLLCSGLALGHGDPTVSVSDTVGLIGPLSKSLASQLLTLATSVVAEVGNAPGRAISVKFMEEIALSITDEGDFGLYLSQVLEILQQQSIGEITLSFASSLAKIAVSKPEQMLPELLRLAAVDKAATTSAAEARKVLTRRNALTIFGAMVEQGFQKMALTAKGDKLRFDMEEIWLQNLQDSDLKIQMMSSHLVSLSMDPHKAISRLAEKLILNDQQVRSSAELALVECMMTVPAVGGEDSDGDAADGLLSFIEFIRRQQKSVDQQSFSAVAYSPSPTKSKSPKNVLSPARNPIVPIQSLADQAATTAYFDRLFDVIRKWAEAVEPIQWPNYIPRLVSKTIASPSDKNLIRVWGTLRRFISESETGCKSFLESITNVMTIQGTLTEEMVEKAMEASDEGLDELRFARLSPLLMLMTIPNEPLSKFLAKDMEGSEENQQNQHVSLRKSLRQALSSRAENPLEFTNVKQLALGAVPALFPSNSLQQIYEKLVSMLDNIQASTDSIAQNSNLIIDARAWIFGFYNWVAVWHPTDVDLNSVGKENQENEVQMVHKMTQDVLFPILKLPLNEATQQSQELYKLQLGTVDVISRLILKTLEFNGPVLSPLAPIPNKGQYGQPVSTVTISEILEDDSEISVTSDNMGAKKVLTKTPKEYFKFLVTQILNLLEAPIQDIISTELSKVQEMHIQTAICLTNVLIMTMQRLTPSPPPESNKAVRGSTSEDKSEMSGKVEGWMASTLLDMVGPRVAEVIRSGCNRLEALQGQSQEQYEKFLAGLLQMFYVGVSSMVAATRAALIQEGHDNSSSIESDRVTNRTTNQAILESIVSGFLAMANVSGLLPSDLSVTHHHISKVGCASLKLFTIMAASGVLELNSLQPSHLVAIRRGLTALEKSQDPAAQAPEIVQLVDRVWDILAR